MKTAKTLSHKMKIGMAITILASALLALASCQKEEQQPDNLSQPDAQLKINLQASNLSLAFASVQINHKPMSAVKPDYSVTVSSNGKVIFEGRKNVRFIGTKTIDATQSSLIAINSLYIRLNHDLTENNRFAGDEGLPVMDQVITTYRATNSDHFISRVDFDNGFPVDLVSFRTKVEKALSIQEFVNTLGPFPDSNEQN